MPVSFKPPVSGVTVDPSRIPHQGRGGVVTPDGRSGTPPRADAALPLVYSCSGASSAAQMANHLAVRLDRAGAAEMSCIAGVGGDVTSLVRVAKSGRPIVAIDGCPLRCVAQILRRHGLTADRHYLLSDHGVARRKHEDFSVSEAGVLLEGMLADLATDRAGPAPEESSEIPAPEPLPDPAGGVR